MNLNIVLGIGISLKLLHGELAQVQEENPLLFKNISLTKKLGFSDVIMPGDIRYLVMFCIWIEFLLAYA